MLAIVEEKEATLLPPISDEENADSVLYDMEKSRPSKIEVRPRRIALTVIIVGEVIVGRAIIGDGDKEERLCLGCTIGDHLRTESHTFRRKLVIDWVSSMDLEDSIAEEGVTNSIVVEYLLSMMQKKNMLPDFILCIGDDRLDEDMFEVINSAREGLTLSPAPKFLPASSAKSLQRQMLS